MAVLSAGLPGITGTYAARELTGFALLVSASGAFYDAGVFEGQSVCAGTSGSNPAKIGFNAALSNSIYGNSSTVQPPALQLIPQICF